MHEGSQKAPVRRRRKEKQETEKAERLKICTDTQDLKKAYSGFPMIIGDDMLKTENDFGKLKNIFLTEVIECPKDAKVEYLGSLTFRFPKNDEL